MTKFHQSLARSYQTADTTPMQMTRRTFVKLGSMAAITGLLPRAVFGSSKNLSVEEKSLAFYNTHTGERLKAVYWAQGGYVEGSLRQISYILRDPRSDEVHDIDTRLLDLLFSVRKEIETNEPFHVISGYPFRTYERVPARAQHGSGGKQLASSRPSDRFPITRPRNAHLAKGSDSS